MNVIGSRPDGWWKDRHGAMVTLVDRLEGWATGESGDVTVVFERPPSTPIRSTVIEIAYAPKAAANSATTRSSGWSEPPPDRTKSGS